MSKDLKIIEIQEGVFVVDTSGPTPNGDAIKRQVDTIFREVNERFDATKIRGIKDDDSDKPVIHKTPTRGSMNVYYDNLTEFRLVRGSGTIQVGDIVKANINVLRDLTEECYWSPKDEDEAKEEQGAVRRLGLGCYEVLFIEEDTDYTYIKSTDTKGLRDLVKCTSLLVRSAIKVPLKDLPDGALFRKSNEDKVFLKKGAIFCWSTMNVTDLPAECLVHPVTLRYE